MEKVHFQQEQMLPDLRSLHDIGIFTASETNKIYRMRSEFERKLIRRVAKKSDYLSYIEYEGRLEKLRSVRWNRLGTESDSHKTFQYSIVRRQLHIFERAVKKFKGDIALWIEYINCAKNAGSNVIAGRVCARAIQLHPNEPYLYILAVSLPQEISKSASSSSSIYTTPSHARSLLQLGIRHNPESIDLWREYVRFEMGFVEWLKRRWAVLGIDNASHDAQEREDQEGRKAILDGAIVKTVIEEGAKALRSMSYFTTILGLLTSESSSGLETDLEEYTFTLLRHIMPNSAKARSLHAQRGLKIDDKGGQDIEELKRTNDEFLAAITEALSEDNGWTAQEIREIGIEYARWVEQLVKLSDIEEVISYLILSLTGAFHQGGSRSHAFSSPVTCAVHLRLLRHLPSTIMTNAQKLKLARIHTSQLGSEEGNEEAWIERLELMSTLGNTREDITSTWREARKQSCSMSLWVWGLDRQDVDHEEVWKDILRDSAASGTLALHQQLLLRYFEAASETRKREDVIKDIRRDYMPTEDFWSKVQG